MGLSLSCIEKHESIERIQYDLRSFKERKLPVVWLVGQQNTGKRTHGDHIEEKFDLEHISVTELLRNEAMKDTPRANLIKGSLNSHRNASDRIVIDLLKEALLRSTNKKGFIISNFPRTTKQAEMFLKEIADVDFIIYLYSETQTLIERAQVKEHQQIDEELMKKSISFATRDIKQTLLKFAVKVENIDTSAPSNDVFGNVETVLSDRLHIQRPLTETEYNRVIEPEEEF